MKTMIMIFEWRVPPNLIALFFIFGFNSALAQTYSIDFENVSKASYALDTININGYRWAMRESVIVSSASDMKNDLRSARIRNSLGDSVYMHMIDDKPNGLGSISFHYARSNFSGDRTGTAPKLAITYSTDGGQNWINIDTLNFAGVDSLVPYVSSPINAVGPIRLQFRTAGGGAGKRINIDDIIIFPFIIINNISLVNRTPMGMAVLPATDALTLSFDDAIMAGSGIISLYELGQVNPQIIVIPSPQVTVQDSTATVAGIQLSNDATYYVHLSAGAFTNTFGLKPNLPIVDDISWRFSTADTIGPLPMTALQETFAHCDDSSSLGVFYQYSSAGERKWRCVASGMNDSTGIGMLGGIAEGVAEVNMDWLISKSAFDFSAMASPILSLWQRRNYDGQVNRDIRISTDFTGSGNPGLATWQILEVQAMTAAPAYGWTPITNILLDSLKHTPFYLAFTYSNTVAGAYEVIYDDITVSNEPLVVVNNKYQENLGLVLLGRTSPSEIHLLITVASDAAVNLRIVDLLGKIPYHKQLRLNRGRNEVTIADLNLGSGMYVINIDDGHSNKAIKAMLD